MGGFCVWREWEGQDGVYGPLRLLRGQFSVGVGGRAALADGFALRLGFELGVRLDGLASFAWCFPHFSFAC